MNIFLLSIVLLGAPHRLNEAPKESISTVEFIQVLNNNKEEALYYYNNNWKQLREAALDSDYIESYLLLEVSPTDEAPFSIILITTYKSRAHYDQAEKNFQELIEDSGGLQLLNDKKPGEFRRTLFSKTEVIHH